MKNCIFVLSALFFSINSVAQDFTALTDQQPAATSEPVQITDNPVFRMEVGRGCCSYHSGQCGCSLGRVVCCDGTMSPSCGCNKEDPPEAKL